MTESDKKVSSIKSELAMFKTVFTVFIAIIASSTIFFHYVEKWNWLDSFHFTIITISTVGYGNLVPATAVGKVFNILLIIVGIGIFTAFISLLVKRQGLKRLERTSRRQVNKLLGKD